MRWKMKTRSAMQSRSFARVIPQTSDSSPNLESSPPWLPKAVAFDLVNFFWLVDTCAHRWYVEILITVALSLSKGLQCHADQDNHRRMKCDQPCMRASCPRRHPCQLLCSEDCGNCMFPIYDVKLPCGHKVRSVPWQALLFTFVSSSSDAPSSHTLENLQAVKCVAQVSKPLPGCEHNGTMACSKDPATFTCKEICGGLTTCCSRRCTSRCHECQKVTKEKTAANSHLVLRSHHRDHACQRLLKCQHPCNLPCSPDHSCNPRCSEACRQRCSHRRCERPCWEPCPPCMEPCEWRCPHHSCPVACGSVSPKESS